MTSNITLQQMEKPSKSQIEKHLEKGGLVCRVVCEILGAPKERVEETVSLLVERARERKERICLSGKVFDIVPQGKFFSTFAELEILFFSKQSLTDFCFNFMPSSVELISPAKLEMQAQEFSNWINEIQGRIHAIDKVGKEGDAIKRLVNKRIASIIRYNLLSHLRRGSLTKEELRDCVGIDEESFDRYFDALQERGEILYNGKKCELGKVVKFNESKE